MSPPPPQHRSERVESGLHLGFAILLTLAAAASFYAPALHATGGDWPAPLDDVYIHFDFARSAARGHPFEWIAGQGFSSGETSVLYPFVLAVGYLAGFRGLSLGAWAAIVACASLVVMMRSLRTLLAPAPRWVSWAGAVMLVAIGVLDWSWFSGMEVALFGAAMLRALVATKRARDRGPLTRASAQWRAGAWGAALVLLRPEAVVLVAPLAIVVARRARAQSAIAALVRAGGPGAAATALVLAINAALTGDPQSAGARLKLLSANPYLTDVDRARELVTNLAYVKIKVLETYLTARPAVWWLLPSLAVIALGSRRTRAIAAACLAGAIAWTLLVSWNGAARFQNYRYYMPALAMVLVAASLGLGAIARWRAGAALGGAIAAAGLALAVPRIPAQIAFFRDASANVHDQQIEVGRRLATRMPPGARVLVGDAGAIPYVSDRGAIDALGLGGYARVPFVLAATHGEPATIELLERLPPEERPAFLALYPNWFARTTSTFGRELDRVTIDHNVICGGVTKGIYAADWSALAAADDDDGTDDALDVADVLSERAHAYESPAPDGGWTLLDVRSTDGRARLFDAGRITPDGRCERFTVARGGEGPRAIAVRTDGDAAADVDVRHARGGSERAALTLDEPAKDGAWRTARATLASGAARGDVISLCARGGPLHDFHVWLTAPGLTRR